jgi:hypothetical protein
VVVAFGCGFFLGREYPRHHYVRYERGGFLFDTATGKVCNPVGDIKTPNVIVEEFRKRHPEYRAWSDDDVVDELQEPAKFRQAFPEYKDWSDADLESKFYEALNASGQIRIPGCAK